ncbi:hypothetical protein V8C86DRAFT_3027447 [Haematococcus lacustris]
MQGNYSGGRPYYTSMACKGNPYTCRWHGLQGAITTLGRGGSDLTATVLGAALQLPEVQVWKDVDGEVFGGLASLGLENKLEVHWALAALGAGSRLHGAATEGRAMLLAHWEGWVRGSRAGVVRDRGGPGGGVLTSDPRLVPHTRPVTELTFEEATELAYFGAQVGCLVPGRGLQGWCFTLKPCSQPSAQAPWVRVKNSYNRTAVGTFITAQRDMSKVLVTSIVLKPNVTLVDIISTRMMGQYGFLATVFEDFRVHKLSVDVVATSEVSVSLTLDPKKLPDIESELGQLKLDLDKIATVSYRRNLAIVSLICNVQRTSRILENVLDVLDSCGINVVMMSQGASKTNISLVVEGADGQKAVLALHKRFFKDSSHVDGQQRKPTSLVLGCRVISTSGSLYSSAASVEPKHGYKHGHSMAMPNIRPNITSKHVSPKSATTESQPLRDRTQASCKEAACHAASPLSLPDKERKLLERAKALQQQLLSSPDTVQMDKVELADECCARILQAMKQPAPQMDWITAAKKPTPVVCVPCGRAECDLVWKPPNWPWHSVAQHWGKVAWAAYVEPHLVLGLQPVEGPGPAPDGANANPELHAAPNRSPLQEGEVVGQVAAAADAPTPVAALHALPVGSLARWLDTRPVEHAGEGVHGQADQAGPGCRGGGHELNTVTPPQEPCPDPTRTATSSRGPEPAQPGPPDAHPAANLPTAQPTAASSPPFAQATAAGGRVQPGDRQEDEALPYVAPEPACPGTVYGSLLEAWELQQELLSGRRKPPRKVLIGGSHNILGLLAAPAANVDLHSRLDASMVPVICMDHVRTAASPQPPCPFLPFGPEPLNGLQGVPERIYKSKPRWPLRVAQGSHKRLSTWVKSKGLQLTGQCKVHREPVVAGPHLLVLEVKPLAQAVAPACQPPAGSDGSLNGAGPSQPGAVPAPAAAGLCPMACVDPQGRPAEHDVQIKMQPSVCFHSHPHAGLVPGSLVQAALQAVALGLSASAQQQALDKLRASGHAAQTPLNPVWLLVWLRQGVPLLVVVWAQLRREDPGHPRLLQAWGVTLTRETL